MNVDASTGRGVLHCIADDVHQYLPQAEGIPHQIFLIYSPDVKAQGLLLLYRLGPHDHHNIVDKVRQGEPLLVQRHPSAVNSGHIQHVVDQTHKVGGRRADLIETVLHPRLLVDMAQADGRHSHDGIHRCADIMGHAGQKAAFGLIGLLRRLQGDPERRILLLQL